MIRDGVRWPLVSVVLVSYKRLELLQRTLEAFQDCCTYPNLEFVLSDDGSPPRQQALMRRLPFDRFAMANKNQGMGANQNKGIRAARGQFIFHLQDDFVCRKRCDFIQESLEVLREVPEIGIIRYGEVWALNRYRVVTTSSGLKVRSFDWQQDDPKYGLYVYSDHPHLKRREFHETLGWYAEGLPVGKTEDEFCRRFLAAKRWRLGYIEGYDLFENIGMGTSTRPDRWRSKLRGTLESKGPGRAVMKTYDRLPLGIRQRLFWRKSFQS